MIIQQLMTKMTMQEQTQLKVKQIKERLAFLLMPLILQL